jgi:tetratricopeptide (TPR) repeat protein
MWAGMKAAVLGLALLLSGCTAMGVPETDDPAEKLRQANSLYDQQGRPFPAEKLIQEAIEIYQARGDDLGLAEAYRQYGFFFRSETVGNNAALYASQGFLDPTATVENRYQKSAEYFGRAGQLFEAAGQFDSLSNTQLNEGFTYHFMNQTKLACAAFDRSLESQRRAERTQSGGAPSLPQGFTSFDSYIEAVRQEAGCPA